MKKELLYNKKQKSAFIRIEKENRRYLARNKKSDVFWGEIIGELLFMEIQESSLCLGRNKNKGVVC